MIYSFLDVTKIYMLNYSSFELKRSFEIPKKNKQNIHELF